MSSSDPNQQDSDALNINEDLDDPTPNEEVPENVGEYDEDSYPDGVDDENDEVPNPSSYIQSRIEEDEVEEEIE